MSDTVKLSAVGTLKATLGAGKINVNDYTLTVTPVENGTNISITRGSQTDTVFVPDYSEDEAERKTAEEGRVAAETARVTAEDARAVAEAARESAETARADAETKRTDAETARATAEAGRDAAEAARVDAESKRVAAENERETAEAARQAAEEKRVDAETARAAAETSRATAETARAKAEDARAKAESQRQTDTAAAISKADAAAESAQSVADTVQAKLDAGELDGYSPSASVTQTDTGATISITDKSGTSTADVKNGSDATVTKDAVISALGYEPASDEWELLNTVTLADITSWVVVDSDSGGNPLKLSKMLAIIDFPDSITVSQTYIGIAKYKWLGYNGSASYKSIVFFAEYIQDQIARGYFSMSRQASTSSNVDYGRYLITTGIRIIDLSYISAFAYYAAGADLSPVGTVIKVYGIRA